MDKDESPWSKQVPPWVAFPAFPPSAMPATQGAEEQWFDEQWRPFWLALNAQEQRNYLDYWQANSEWREALNLFFYRLDDYDPEEDLRESEAIAAERREKMLTSPSFWSRLKRKWVRPTQ